MSPYFDAALVPLKAVDVKHPGIFGGDHDDEPGQLHEGDGLNEAAHAEVTAKFCRPDRTTPLSQPEGRALCQKLRGNGYNPCSVKLGSKAPFGEGWQKRAFEDASTWTAKAPGIGLVCGGLDQNGEPAPIADGLIVLDHDFRLTKKVAEYARLANEAITKNRPGAKRLRKIADHLQAIEPALKEVEQNLCRLLGEQCFLAELRASTLERGRSNNANFALLFRNSGALDNAKVKLHLPVRVDGETEFIEAFGIDRLAAGAQLVGFHLHPDTGEPWLWKDERSPEGVALVELPQIDAGQWDALWREIVEAGATLGLVETGGAAAKRSVGGGAKGGPGVVLAAVEEKEIVDLLAANWPMGGSRHEAALALGGFLCRCGLGQEQIAEVVRQAAEAAGDDEVEDRARAAESAVSAQAKGTNIAGWSRVAELLGNTVADRLTRLCKPGSASRADAAEPGYISFAPFEMDAEHGLTKQVMAGRGKNSVIETVWISASFEILGQCRDPQGRAWGKQIRFRDADGRVHMRHVSEAALHGDPAALCAELAHEGLRINRSKQRELAEYMSGLSIDERVTIVRRTGWHEIGGHLVFVLPSDIISVGARERVALDTTAHGPYEARGSLEDWKEGVGALTAGHTLPVFMVSAALAGPLAHLVGAEGGGVHVFGGSSIGKSAMLAAGASVWGRGDEHGYLRSWRATANGLEGAAASATDTCLVLDELGVGEARAVAAMVYSLANGSGKQRARRDGSPQEPRGWRVFVLSSGEHPVETKIAEDYGRKARAGQAVRLLDVPADRGVGFGAFDNGGESADAGKLADAIKDAARSAYGTAGPELVRRLVASGIEQIVALARERLGEFIAKFVVRGSSEQIARAAKKFALIGIAGELATGLGVTPWAKGEALKAARWAFNRWLETRGGVGSHEERQAIEQVRLLIVQHGGSRFERVDVPPPNLGGAPIIRDRLGWVKGEGDQREWWVPPEIWKAEVCNGLDPTFVARTLASKGMLRRQGDGRNLTCVVAIPGGQKTRCYVLTADILGE